MQTFNQRKEHQRCILYFAPSKTIVKQASVFYEFGVTFDLSNKSFWMTEYMFGITVMLLVNNAKPCQ